MQTATLDAAPRSISSRLARVDAFGLFLAGFILLHGLVSLGLEHGAGVIGFAKTPYLNAGTYAYATVFAALMLILDRTNFRVAVPHPLAILMVFLLIASAITGVANSNPGQYIVAWTVYFITALVMFQIFRRRKGRPEAAGDAIDTLYALPFLLLVLAFTVISIPYKDNHYQYVLFEVIALYAMLIRKSWIEKAIGALVYLFIHLGSNDGFVQVEINRASILALGAVGLIWLLYRRYLVTIVIGAFVVAGALAYALSLDDQTVDTLPRNIKEAIYLMKGDDIYNHVSSYQRVYEGQKVMEDYETAKDLEWLSGKGLGRTVDMTGAADKTPGQHALMGALDVHNIHFLHYAVFHKFGILGLALLGSIIIGLVWMFAVDLGTRRLEDVRMFFYFYLFYNLVFAVPASNFLIANPLWPAFLGMLCWIRSGERSTPGASAALT